MPKPQNTATASTATVDVQLGDLRNVGHAFVDKFEQLGIESISQLADQSPDDLYVRLCHLEHERLDPCVHDVFAATIHQAKTGEALDWWAFTADRKVRQTVGDFPDI